MLNERACGLGRPGTRRPPKRGESSRVLPARPRDCLTGYRKAARRLAAALVLA